jgi:purine-binding chemotaxis protein CheW
VKVSKGRAEAQRTLVGFLVGEVDYAIDVGHVVQIIHPMSLSPLPHLPPAVVGVADFRGEVVPVVDLRQRFGVAEGRDEGRRSKWIVARIGGALAALVGDSVSDVFGLPTAEFRPAPPLSGGDLRGVASVATHHDDLIFVLDLERLRPLIDAAHGEGAGARPELDHARLEAEGPRPRAELGAGHRGAGEMDTGRGRESRRVKP